MTWFKVDDQFWAHPKTLLLSDSAVALWVKAGAWSAQHLTDGHVPAGVLRLIQAQKKHADELVRAGLWRVHERDGWVFHDWLEYQPTRKEVEERRSAWRSRQNKHRSQRRSPGGQFTVIEGDVTGGVTA